MLDGRDCKLAGHQSGTEGSIQRMGLGQESKEQEAGEDMGLSLGMSLVGH